MVIIMLKIAFFSTKPYDTFFFDAENKTHGFEITYFNAGLTSETASLCEGFDIVCAFVNDVLDKSCIDALAHYHIKTIALRSAGFNHVDLNACQTHGIKVVRVPAYSPYAVAEHTMALLLTLVRKTHKAYQRIREGNFALEGLLGFDLYKKTIGIIGLGTIGKRFASICQGFGMKIIAYDPAPDTTERQSCTVELVTLASLLQHSDIISLHCPLTETNRHMINSKSIQAMKDDVVLINTGRGGLIDTKALIEGLKSKKISAVGLDVYEQEGAVFFEDHSQDIIDDDMLMRLTTFPNVLITSHQGFFTKEALTHIASITLSNINTIKEGKACPNEVMAVASD